MSQQNKIQLFEQKKVRTVWDEEQEKWFFSIIDVVGILTYQPDYQVSQHYWTALKAKLQKGRSELSHNLGQLKNTFC